MNIREKRSTDDAWIAALLQARWGGTVIVVHGEALDAMALPALVAGDGEGLATYRLRGDEAELISLDAVNPGHGIGTRLVNTLVERLSGQGARRLWVTTTNDNLAALSFYQRRGFRLRRVHVDAIVQARLIKPGIPLLGENGIPIRDELDLCREL